MSISTVEDLIRVIGIPFSEQQLAAITAPLEPGVIVAGAGSGKTTVMAARVVWLVGTGQVEPGAVLGLTFTNKAAGELGHDVRSFLDKAGFGPRTERDDPRAADDATADDATVQDVADEIGEPTVLTYHAYAARLLTEHGLRIGHEPDSRLIADASRFQLAARAVRSHDRPVDHLTTWLPTNVNGLLQLDAQLSEHLVEPDRVREFCRSELERWEQAPRSTLETRRAQTSLQQRIELLDLVEAYSRIKARLGVIDFSDQMALAATLAMTRPEVGATERSTYRIVLLDEYQDTSVAQAVLLTALFADRADPDGRGHPVTAVGDPCQAIYGWRGASVGNIESFGTDFPCRTGETRRYALSVNRRSQTRILQAANDLATELYALHRGVEPLTARTDAGAGAVRAAVLETYADELAFLGAEVPRAHQSMPVPTWSEIAVLVRDNKTAGDVHDVLTAAGVPVEVIGLSGLLRMPEVVQVVATLQVLHDVTANAALLTLLSSPRWAIGTRDLAMLGRRAKELARGVETSADDVAGKLEEAVAGTDQADIVSLVEALESPGSAAFSAEARRRFGLLAQELRMLRRYVGEPLLDLVRRVVDTTALDVELASSTSAVAAARRDNVATFLDAVATFAGIDGDASLPGLLAYLEAEEEYAQGLALAVPTQADSVKLLTVHRAKGLEWDIVFLPGMCSKVFPSAQGRSRWPTSMVELPAPLRGDCADLPQLGEASSAGLRAYVEACREHELLEERRLGYVALTRPRHELVVSCHWWGPEQKQVRGPSDFFTSVVASMQGWGQVPEVESPAPAADAVNPANRTEQPFPWPVAPGAEEVAGRRAAAGLVRAAAELGPAAAREAADDGLMLDEHALVARWDRELTRLIDEARHDAVDEVLVALPTVLSATALERVRDDPEGFARSLARPMPRRPSASARFGTRFHAWVEGRFGQQEILDPDDLPGRADAEIDSESDLGELISRFEAGPYADRRPHSIEAPFALVLAGQVVRGRIDAVYQTATGYEVVDWKTNREATADPLQLALYRLAWAELAGVDPSAVTGVFYYVRRDEVVEYTDLPGRTELEALVVGEAGPA